MRPQTDGPRARQSSQAPVGRRTDPLALVTLGGVIALLMISFANMRDIARIERGLQGQRVQAAARPAPVNVAPAPPGEDPERIYTVSTAGAPVRGPLNAPVTIAEFSDFQ